MSLLTIDRAVTGLGDVGLPSEGGPLDRVDLLRIVELSGLGGAPLVGKQHTLYRMVDWGGRRFKVRAFRSGEWAQRQLELAARLPHLFPRCYGRVEHCLIWEYVEMAPDSKNRMNEGAIADFLAEFTKAVVDPLSGKEVGRWCEDMARLGMLLPQTVQRIERYYEQQSQLVKDWHLEYLDAVPKNFIFDKNGRFLSVDAKHIFPGPRGLSLIKLHCHKGRLITKESYDRLVREYQQRVGFEEYEEEEYFDFLLFYYCMVLLADNARYTDRKFNLESKRNRWRKSTVLQLVGAPLWLRVMEEATSGMPFHAHRLREFSGRLARLKQVGIRGIWNGMKRK